MAELKPGDRVRVLTQGPHWFALGRVHAVGFPDGRAFCGGAVMVMLDGDIFATGFIPTELMHVGRHSGFCCWCELCDGCESALKAVHRNDRRQEIAAWAARMAARLRAVPRG